jgi:acyl-CoA thioesterase FadM
MDEFASIVGRFPSEVYWGDCDPAGIIFYPTYFRWMDAATWAFMASVGYSPKRMREEHLSMPLIGAECKFVAPAQQRPGHTHQEPADPGRGQGALSR